MKAPQQMPFLARLIFAVKDVNSGVLLEYDLQYRWLLAADLAAAQRAATAIGQKEEETIVQPDGTVLAWEYESCDWLVPAHDLEHGTLLLSQSRLRDTEHQSTTTSSSY